MCYSVCGAWADFDPVLALNSCYPYACYGMSELGMILSARCLI